MASTAFLTDGSVAARPQRAGGRKHPVAPAAEGALDAENLRLLGFMTAGVSHDLRNVLGGVWLHLQVLERSGADKAGESVAQLRRAVTLAVELLDQLRTFSAGHVQPVVDIQLATLARQACELGRMSVRSHSHAPIVIRETHDWGAPTVKVHRAEMVSAIVNLIINAGDAMPRGGSIDVTTGAAEGAVYARVSDEGPGIAPAVQQRLFEPFFTTKGPAGTGLGLAQVRECMRRHGGRVELQTRPGSGAAFTLWLPVGA